MRRAALTTGLALALSAATLLAQEDTVRIGTRVRIETTAKEKFDGILLSRDTDSIVVRRSVGARAMVPTASVARLRVSEGRSHSAGLARGITYGAIIGTSLAGAASLGFIDDEPEAIPFLFAGGAAFGTVLGGLVGAVGGAERWTTVYGRPVRVSYRPHLNGRLSVGLRIN